MSADELPSIQELIDSGVGWLLEGNIGRQCMDAIRSGHAMFGKERRRDYYGNVVPSRCGLAALVAVSTSRHTNRRGEEERCGLREARSTTTSQGRPTLRS
jgi:hypothetical protein